MQWVVNDGSVRSGQGSVVVVGAGLAGLTCAKVLAGAGRDVILLEASGEPGGSVASRRHADGFILDLGFQVLMDSYPAARRHLDLPALGGGRFRSGALLVGRGRPFAIENPLFRPAAVSTLLHPSSPSWPDLRRLGLLVLGAMLRGRRRLALDAASASDVAAARLLANCGFSADFLDRLAGPFLGGVLLDPALETSAAWMMACLAPFATGRALLPGAGMGAIGAQLAAHLPPGSIRYKHRVEGVIATEAGVSGVRMGDGSVIGAEAVVLATDEPATCRLLGRGSPRGARATAVHYFAAERAWHEGGWLCLPPRSVSGPLLHAALLTNVAPELAPPGRHLWSVTVVPGQLGADDAERVASEVAGWFGEKAAALEPLDFIRVDYAVPLQPPGFAARSAPWGALPRGLWVAGDAVAGASIDAAMRSGEVAAKSLLSPAVMN
jgi:phytoene dehydrogenase-like protein